MPFGSYNVMEVDNLLLWSCLVSLISSLFFTIIVHVLRTNDTNRRIKALESDVDAINSDLDSLDRSLRGRYGRSVRSEKEERKQEAMSEAMTLFAQGKKPEEILAILGPKYLDVGLELLLKNK